MKFEQMQRQIHRNVQVPDCVLGVHWKFNPLQEEDKGFGGGAYLRVTPVLSNWRINFRQGRRGYTADRHCATGCVQVRGDSSCLACLTFVYRQSAKVRVEREVWLDRVGMR